MENIGVSERQTCTMSQFYMPSVHVIFEQMDEEIKLVRVYEISEKTNI